MVVFLSSVAVLVAANVAARIAQRDDDFLGQQAMVMPPE